MAGESTFAYTATRGVKSLGTEVLETLIDDTVETLGLAATDLITNGDFPTNTTGWTAQSSATLSVVSAKLRVTNGAAVKGVAEQSITTVSGKIYEITLDFGASTASGGRVIIGTSSVSDDLGRSDFFTSTTGIKVTFKASSTTTYIAVQNNSATMGVYTDYDNIVVHLSNNIVPNGQFYTSVNWTLGTGWTISGGVATHASGNTPDMTQSISVVAGKAYVVTFTVSGVTTSSVNARFLGGTTVGGSDRSANGTYTETLTAATGNVTLAMNPGTTFDGSVDDIKIFPAVPDSSSNGDGVEIHGEITKAVVNTGSELVAYSGFSADNYLEQPYSSNLDFGTGDFTLCGWIRTNSLSGDQYIAFKGDGSATSLEWYLSTTSILILTRASSTNSFITVASGITTGTWYFFCATRGTTGTELKLYKDSVLIKEGTVTARDIDTTNAFTLGYASVSASSYLDGSLSLVKVFGSELTATQIKTIYNDEKHLFQRYASFHLIGVSYTVSTSATVKSPENTTVKRRKIALDQITVQSTILGRTTFFDVTSALINYDALGDWREFEYSTSEDEIFTFTPGAGYEPNESFDASIEKYRETRVGDTNKFRVSLKLRKRE